jgi:RND family efflux transporter MFP subunit
MGLLWASVLAGCGQQEPYQKPLTPVGVQVVQPYSSSGAVRYSASIEPHSRVDLAFKVSGYVSEILQLPGADGRRREVQQGDRVTQGTVLARLRESDYVAKVNQARSELSAARASLEQARLDFDRAKRLIRTHAISQSDHDAVKAKFEAAKAGIEGAEAQLEEARIALADTALKAPMDAVVLSRAIERGSLVSSGTVSFVLADTRSMKAVFGVPDVVVRNLKLGDELTVTTEALPGTELRGQITALSPSADPKSRVFSVEITLPNPDRRLSVGMIATVQVPGLPSAPAVAVPLSAIVRAGKPGGGYAVFVVESEQGRAVARLHEVTLGEVFGNRVAVIQGVKVGDRLIVSGATLVIDGEPVAVIP